MQIALRQLLLDFLSAAFFYAVITLGGSTTLALAIGVFALALINVVVAATCSLQTWAAYASVGPTIAKVVGIAITYVVLRTLVNRKLGPAPS